MLCSATGHGRWQLVILPTIFPNKLMNNNKRNKARKNNNKSSKGRSRKGSRTGKTNMNKQISVPSAMGRVLSVTGANDVRLKKREYVMDLFNETSVNRPGITFRKISGSNGLLTTIASIAVNAGLGGVFPWLSSAASCFEQFVFHTLKFEYVPSCGTSTVGAVALAPSYDPNRTTSTNYFDKTDYLDRVGTVRTPVWSGASCSLPSSKLNSAYKSHFVRSSSATVSDLARTDPAVLDIIKEGTSLNSQDNVGELWVEYDVSLKIPKGNTQGIAKMGYATNMTVGSSTYIGTAHHAMVPIGVPYQFSTKTGTVGAHEVMWYPESTDVGCYLIQLTVEGNSVPQITSYTTSVETNDETHIASKSINVFRSVSTNVSDVNGNDLYEFKGTIWIYLEINGMVNTDTYVKLNAAASHTLTYLYMTEVTAELAKVAYDLALRSIPGRMSKTRLPVRSSSPCNFSNNCQVSRV